MKEQILINLRQQLAEIGNEFTPEQLRDTMERAAELYDTVDLDIYRYFRDLTIGGVAMLALREKVKPTEMCQMRDIILFVGERRYPDEPKRIDKSSLT